VVLLMLCFLTMMPVIFSTLVFLAQFVSKRYHTRIAYTGYVQTVLGVAQIIVVLVIIPYLSNYTIRPTCPKAIRMADERQRDLGLTRWSFIALALGALVMAISPALPGFVCGLLIMALGTGASSYLSSTLALYVDQEHRTRMFSMVSIVNIAGSIYAMPALAGLFTLGMRLGGAWISLPYLGVSTLCVVAILLLLFVRLPNTAEADDEQHSAHSRSSDTAVDD
jgi:MFS family permease